MIHTYKLQDFCTRYGLLEHDTYLLSQHLPSGVWIAGGAVRDMISGIPIRSDVDYFFNSKDKLLDYLPESAKEVNTNYVWFDDTDLKHQAIGIDYYPDARALLETFDFTICMAAVDKNNLYVGQYTLHDIARKRLQVNKITYGAASVRRCFKYMQYGFTACHGCLTELLKQVSDNPSTLTTEVKYVD